MTICFPAGFVWLWLCFRIVFVRLWWSVSVMCLCSCELDGLFSCCLCGCECDGLFSCCLYGCECDGQFSCCVFVAVGVCFRAVFVWLWRSVSVLRLCGCVGLDGRQFSRCVCVEAVFVRPTSVSCLESEGCHVILLSYLFSSFSTWSCCCFCRFSALMVHALSWHFPTFFVKR